MSENIGNLRISMVTSGDQRFPAENILDGTVKTFWTSTGLFPQEFIVTLPTTYVLKKVTVWSMKVAAWTISRAGIDTPFDYDEIYSEDIEDSPETSLQVTAFSVAYSDIHHASAAKHVKFTIRRGHADFVAVYRIALQGEAVPEREEKALKDGGRRLVMAGDEEEEDEDVGSRDIREDEGDGAQRRVVQVGGRD